MHDSRFARIINLLRAGFDRDRLLFEGSPNRGEQTRLGDRSAHRGNGTGPGGSGFAGLVPGHHRHRAGNRGKTFRADVNSPGRDGIAPGRPVWDLAASRSARDPRQERLRVRIKGSLDAPARPLFRQLPESPAACARTRRRRSPHSILEPIPPHDKECGRMVKDHSHCLEIELRARAIGILVVESAGA